MRKVPPQDVAARGDRDPNGATEALIDRRRFLRSTGLVAIAGVGVACGGDDGRPDAPKGTIRVTINGLGAGATSAGSAVISGENIATLTLTLPAAAASATALVPVGTYHVVYSPPAGYTMAPGQANEFDVTVLEDEETEVIVDIVPASGTLQITIDGLSPEAADGGSASVLRTDIGGQTPLAVPIPAAGSASVSLVPGTYSVTYTPPEAHELAAGETNPASVVVSSGATANVGFTVEVVEQIGTLRITVTGLDGDATSGGQAQATRTDIGGQTPIPINVPDTGTVDTVVPSGTYSVQYFAPSGHQVVDGTTNPQEVEITTGATGTATFAVEVVDSSGVLFHSDWSTATGNSADAMLDSSKEKPWDIEIGNGHANEVVAATGLGFPAAMANCLKCVAEFNGSFAPTELIKYSQMGDLAVGGKRFFRVYFRVETPDAYDNTAGADSNTHPHQDGDAQGDSNWLFQVFTGDGADGEWRLRFNCKLLVGPNSLPAYTCPFLQKFKVYRIEWMVHRATATEFELDAKVFDETVSLTDPIHDGADFDDLNSSNTLATTPAPRHVITDATKFGQILAGHNGVSSAVAPGLYPYTLYYQGGLCVRDDDWCGPYSGGI